MPSALLIARTLLDGGARVDAQLEGDGTPLHHAAGFIPSRKMVELLIERGADVSAEDRRGRTPLDAAVEACQEKGSAAACGVTELLREHLAGKRAPPAAGVAAASPHAVERALPAPLKPSFRGAATADDLALVIGIDRYAELPPASHAERDADAARDFFRAMGVPDRNIMILKGARATKTGFEKTVEAWLPNNARPGSRAFVYYSGHGAPDPATGDAYLVPYDGDPQYLAQTGFPLKRLYQALGRLKARRIVVMLDSCFSGAGGRSVLAKGTRPLVGKIMTAPPAESAGSRLLVTASGPDQISGSDETAGHGLFTKHLLEGLNGGAKDAQGRVTLASLYDYLKPRVEDEARRGNREQAPKLIGEGAPDLVLRP